MVIFFLLNINIYQFVDLEKNVFNILQQSCRIYQYNEDDLRIKFVTFTKLSNSMDTQKHGNKEKLSISNISLLTAYIEKLSSLY